MVRFAVQILKFEKQGEKTGWTYIEIPAAIAQRLKRGNRKTFRVKGKLDDVSIKGVALLPMGGGDFIMALNAAMRRAIGKKSGATLDAQLEVDPDEPRASSDLVESMNDEPEALAFFNSLTRGHQQYFNAWIESAKTQPTKARRIARTVNACLNRQGFAEMMRSLKSVKSQIR